MASITRTDLVNADGIEVTNWLNSHGITLVSTNVVGDAMIIEAAESAEQIEAALVGFVPTAPRGQWREPVPDVVKNAYARLIARAQAGDVVARDVLILLRFTNSRIEET